MSFLRDIRTADMALVAPLIGREYYFRLAKAVPAARESLDYTVFQAAPGSLSPHAKPARLVNLIAAAHQRGLACRVLINMSSTPTISAPNAALAGALTRKGVPVRLTRPGDTVHGKVLILDRRLVVIGSHNLTQRGLWDNYEASAALESAAAGAAYTAWFSWLWDRAREVDGRST